MEKSEIKALIKKMTLEEKAGLCSGLDFWHTKPVKRLGIPSAMVSDGPHGLRKEENGGTIKAVCMPSACTTAASFDRELIRRMGEAIGRSCQHENISVVLGPAINIKRSPLCGRNFEYLSEDPYLAGEMAAEYINGVQSQGVGTSIKHFAANSQEHRRFTSSSNVDERTLREIYFPAFETAVKKARPWTVMCSYNKINGTYSSENKWLLTDVLRGEWGFDGYVMSDWGAVSDRVKGVVAGLDLEMPSSGGYNDKKIIEAVRSGKLDEEAVDLAVERILTVCYKYFENARPDTPWDKDADHLLSAEIAEECMVLLKNDGALPLSKEDNIAFIGEFAESPRYQGGGSSHINSFKVTSALEAAKQMGLSVSYERGYDVKNDISTSEMIASAVKAAKNSKTAVVFAGLPDSYESEGYDRPHMRMPDCQNKLIEAVAAANPNTVVVLHNGSPVEMPWLGKVNAVLEAYLGGQAEGIAVIRLLYGDANPCGHLAETFPIKLSDNPSYLSYGGEGDNSDYREGIFVGYRYYDKKELPVLFPFGHGLSYTEFEYTDLKLSSDSIKDTDTLTATVTVKNIGTRLGKTVVQFYVGDDESSVFRPVRELKGFEKVLLQPGESKQVSVTLDKRSFSYYSTDIHDWYAETGEYTVEVGQSSRDIKLSATVMVISTSEKKRRFTPDTAFIDVLSDPDAVRKIEPILKKIRAEMHRGEDKSENVNYAMDLAMLNYSPLRAVLMLGRGEAGEIMEKTVDLLNS